MAVRFSEEVKEHNLNRIYHVIRQGCDVSRASLAKETGLSATSIGRSVGKLIENGYVCESHPIEGNIGRQPITLQIVPGRIVVISINVTKDYVYSCCVDAAGEVYLRAKHKPANLLPLTVVEIIKCAIDDILGALSKDERQNIAGIGICIPGGADYQTGCVIYSHTLQWKNVNLAAMLSCYYAYPIIVDDYVKGIAKQYYYSQKMGTYEDYMVLHFGDEVSLATMSGRKIHRGMHNISGDIGHFIVPGNGWDQSEDRLSFNTLIGQEEMQRRFSMDFKSALEAYRDGRLENIPDMEHVLNLYAKWLAVLMVTFCSPRIILSGTIIDESKFFLENIKLRYGRFLSDTFGARAIVCHGSIREADALYSAPAMNVFYKIWLREGGVVIKLND